MRISILSSLSLLFLAILTSACGGGDTSDTEKKAPQSMLKTAEAYDPTRGEGKFSEVALGDGLDMAMVASGEKIAASKCQSCHKLTDERLVGPGWAGVTERRTPVWLMNFATNPGPMIDKDPELQAQLELCLVRMPDQNLSDDDARHILEFMRKNDTGN